MLHGLFLFLWANAAPYKIKSTLEIWLKIANLVRQNLLVAEVYTSAKKEEPTGSYWNNKY